MYDGCSIECSTVYHQRVSGHECVIEVLEFSTISLDEISYTSSDITDIHVESRR